MRRYACLAALSAGYWALVYEAHERHGFVYTFPLYFAAGACMVYFGAILYNGLKV
jgi:hypothetical protein